MVSDSLVGRAAVVGGGCVGWCSAYGEDRVETWFLAGGMWGGVVCGEEGEEFGGEETEDWAEEGQAGCYDLDFDISNESRGLGEG